MPAEPTTADAVPLPSYEEAVAAAGRIMAQPVGFVSPAPAWGRRARKARSETEPPGRDIVEIHRDVGRRARLGRAGAVTGRQAVRTDASEDFGSEGSDRRTEDVCRRVGLETEGRATSRRTPQGFLKPRGKPLGYAPCKLRKQSGPIV